MQHFYRATTRHPKTMVALFVLLAAFCTLCQPLIAVNYDMNDYLPPETASTVALDAMDAEYDGGVPNARVMVRNVTIPEAMAYKQALEKIDGVTSVVWLDDAASVEQPLETLDQDTVSGYYQDGAALFSVTIAEDQRIEAVDAIRKLIGDDNAMSGSAVSTAVATTSTVSQIWIISIAAVAFVLLVLILTTTSWLEPLVVLGSLGVAILINSGSNLIFGEISFVSNAAGSILQLAVSLDYSIFLLHRFEECRRETPDPREAMVEALCKSTMSILSSGLTTVIGFLALCLMQFQIGPDMGLVLGKGVAISLVTVFLFSPSLILLCHKLLEKTRHRSFMPSFHRLGRCVTRLMIPVMTVLLLLSVPAYLGSGQNRYYYGSSHIFGANTQLGADIEAIEDVFGKSELTDHNEELLDGARQIVDAVFETANETLQESKDEFDALGIELRTLTIDNYSDEIERLQSELLDKVDDYVRRKADQQLAGMVQTAARQQVTEQVQAGAEQQVRAAVEAQARQKVEAEICNPSEEMVNAQVEQQMQTPEVQAEIDAAVEAQLASPEVQAQIDAQLTAAVRPQVEAAVEAEVRNQVQAAVRQQVRAQVSARVEAEIRAAVMAELTQPTVSTEPTATPAPETSTEPTETPAPETSAESTATPAPETGTGAEGSAESSMETLIPIAEETVVVPSGETVLLPEENASVLTGGGLAAWIRSLLPLSIRTARAEGTPSEDQVNAIVSARMASAEVQAQIDAMTDAEMSSAETQAAVDAQVRQQMNSAEVQATIDSQTRQKISDPAVRAQAEEAARQQIRPQVEAAARQKIRNEIVNLSDEQIQALVEQQMQSAEVQAQIDAAVAEQMSSQQVQDRIASEIETQMASDDVQKKIDEETAAQLASTDTQTLLQNLIDQQMVSDEVQQLIAQNVKEQMASSEVQNLIDQNIESQMASEQVRSRISAEMANQRQSRQYLDSVAEALEENGENGEAYRALSDLRDTLDDVQKFYDGLKDYTDGVNELRDGAQEMKDGTEEFRSETAGINDTLNEKIDDMIAEKTGSDVALSSFVDPRNTDVDNVQFVITTPAVRAVSVQNEEETVPEETGVLEKIRNLFR